MKDAASDHDSESAKDSFSDSEDLKPSQIATMGFERRSGVPGFEIETYNDEMILSGYQLFSGLGHA